MYSLILSDFSDTAEALQKSIANIVPEGFTLGKLQPHHSKMVTSHWPRLHGWPNKEPYFKELINVFHCPALYTRENPDVPVSYIVQFPSNQHFAYTDKRYQGSQLSNYPGLMIHVNVAWIDKFWPFEEETAHPGRISLVTEMFGGTLTDYKVKDLIINPFTDSKL